jgi:hypothetical protein
MRLGQASWCWNVAPKVHSHTAKLGDDAIANELHNAAIMGGDCRLEDGFPMPFQSGQRARLVSPH